MSVRIEPLSSETVAGAVALQRDCFPPPFPEELLWSAEHLREHLSVFPEGQFVAIADGKVVGSASALIVSEESWHAHRDWETTTGGHFMKNHDPGGTTLYGMDISVHPGYRGMGVGRMLYEARFELVRGGTAAARSTSPAGLRRYGTACRIPGFAAWASANTPDPESYCRKVAQGELTDRTLTPLLRYGLRFVQAVEGYMDDEESRDCAALLEWTP